MEDKEFKASHFKNIEELLQHCGLWIYEEDYDAYFRFYDFGAMTEMFNYIEKLQQQLEAYKDKEDKLRECCMPLITLNNIDCCKECGSTNIKQNYKPYKIAEDILQILNEGDK